MAPTPPTYLNRRPRVSISLYDEKDTYTNGSRIHGHATVTSHFDRAFSSVEVAFVGKSQTWVDGSITAAGEFRSGASQTFLKLSQSDARSRLPVDGILRAGQQYQVPFNFTIPERLSNRSCQHLVESVDVRDAHLYLPPSFSDGDGNADALAPVMADVQYNVVVGITRAHEGHEVIASRMKSVWFVPSDSLPATDDEACLDEDRITETTKSLKCTLWMGQHGSLNVKSSEPQCMLPLDSGCATVDVDLDFVAGQCATPRPPTVESISASLEGTTYYASSARKTFSSKSSYIMDSTQGRYRKSLKLYTMNALDLCWKADRASGRKHASVTIPIVLPSNKRIAPTFHSCLISRTYSLHLRFKLKTSGPSTHAELNVPVHVSKSGAVIMDAKPLLDFELGTKYCWEIDPVPTYAAREEVEVTA